MGGSNNFFSWPVPGLTNRPTVRDSNPGAPLPTKRLLSSLHHVITQRHILFSLTLGLHPSYTSVGALLAACTWLSWTVWTGIPLAAPNRQDTHSNRCLGACPSGGAPYPRTKYCVAWTDIQRHSILPMNGKRMFCHMVSCASTLSTGRAGPGSGQGQPWPK